ncbi:MAG: hypothetical protein ACRDJ5_05900 [Actinomycetota bacterium]
MGTRSAEELVRVVTARQLARETSRLLDELHREGTCLLVTRHGYPVAAMYAAGTSNLRAAIRSAATMAEPPDAGTVDVTAELGRLALDPRSSGSSRGSWRSPRSMRSSLSVSSCRR